MGPVPFFPGGKNALRLPGAFNKEKKYIQHACVRSMPFTLAPGKHYRLTFRMRHQDATGELVARFVCENQGLWKAFGDNQVLKGVDLDEKRMKRTEAIVLSMTKEERTRPEIIKASRRRRIAMGSGTSVTQVNQLLKQFGEMRKLMRNKGKMSQMMKQFGGGRRPF